MQVDSLMVPDGGSAYYTDGFRNTLEDFMTLFRQGSLSPTVVTPALAERFIGDLFGLLTVLQIPPQIHYAVMRANKLNSSDDYQASMTNLIVPDQTEIQRILQANNTTNRTTN